MQDNSKYIYCIASFYVAYALFNITDIREQIISKITIIFIMIASGTSTYATRCVLLFIREVYVLHSSITIYLMLTNEVSYYYKILQHNMHITKHPIK